MNQTFLIAALVAVLALLAGALFAWWRTAGRLADLSDGGKDEIGQHMAVLMKAQGEIT